MRILKILGAHKTELAQIDVPEGEAPIKVEVLNENIWGIFELSIAEVKEIAREEVEAPGEEGLPVAESAPEPQPGDRKPRRGKRVARGRGKGSAETSPVDSRVSAEGEGPGGSEPSGSPGTDQYGNRADPHRHGHEGL